MIWLMSRGVGGEERIWLMSRGRSRGSGCNIVTHVVMYKSI